MRDGGFVPRVTEAAHSIVPSAQAFSILTAVSIGCFMAGVGTIVWFGDIADNITLVPGIVETQEIFRTQLNIFESRLDDGDQARQQILCLVRLTAAGEQLTPLEVQVYLEDPERCP